MTTKERGLVAPSDIAELAGVSRGAVSNWRKRAEDFPSQVAGTIAKPLFDLGEVVAWLRGRGYEIKRERGEATAWAALNGLRSHLPAEQFAPVILSLLCARRLSSESNAPDSPWTAIRTQVADRGFRVLEEVADEESFRNDRWGDLVHLPEDAALVPAAAAHLVVDAVDAIRDEDLSAAADYALQRIAAAQIRSGAEHGFVGSRMSSLLVNLAAGWTDRVVYDPACGVGTVLTAMHDAGAHPKRVVGHDINRHALRIAAQRFYLRGVEAELVAADVLRRDVDADLRADVIVLEPPFGMQWSAPEDLTDPRWQFGVPGRSSADLAWVQHCVAHLTDHGRAFVVTPMGALWRGGPERAIRLELLRHGCVEAVLGLPGRMLPHVSIPLAVWVVRRPRAHAPDDGVLLVDGSQLEDPETQLADWESLAARPAAEGPPLRVVLTTDLLAADANLAPTKWLAVQTTDVDRRDAHVSLWRELREATTDLHATVMQQEGGVDLTPSRVFTIENLLSHGVIEMRAGKLRPKSDDLPEAVLSRVVTTVHVREGLPAAPPELPAPEADLITTAAGDVLVTTMFQTRACVDDQGGHVPAAGVYTLHVAKPEVLSSYFLAAMIMGSWNVRYQQGSGVTRAAIRSLEIPLIPLEDQRRVEQALLASSSIAARATSLAATADALTEALQDAVRQNTGDGAQFDQDAT